MSHDIYDLPRIALVWHESPIGTPILVAIVMYHTDDYHEALDECFTSTNNIEHDWRKNTNVIATNLGVNRSTSVGDYIQLGQHLYRCDPNGWTHVAPTTWQLIKSLFIR